jgi:hypothetical protein
MTVIHDHTDAVVAEAVALAIMLARSAFRMRASAGGSSMTWHDLAPDRPLKPGDFDTSASTPG